jgi:hypothetical protein
MLSVMVGLASPARSQMTCTGTPLRSKWVMTSSRSIVTSLSAAGAVANLRRARGPSGA